MKYFCPVFATGVLLLLGQSATAQTAMDECEKLKIDNAKLKFENANLKKGIIARSPTTAPVQVTGGQTANTQAAPAQSGQQQTQGVQRQTLQRMEFALIKAQGNAKAQTVTVTLLLTNKDANKTVHIVSPRAIDDQADEHQTNGAQIGTSGSSSLLTTGVPVKALITITRVLPTVKTLRVFSFEVYTSVEFNNVPLEFRDVAISWK